MGSLWFDLVKWRFNSIRRKNANWLDTIYNSSTATSSKERRDQGKNRYTLFYYCILNYYLKDRGLTSLLAVSDWSHTTTNHGSQRRSRCWFYGGRKTGEPGETNHNNSTHTSSKFFDNIDTRLYPGGHPSSYNPVRSTGLHLKFSGERQRAKHVVFRNSYEWTISQELHKNFELISVLLNRIWNKRYKML